jgi:hypothetical protein
MRQNCNIIADNHKVTKHAFTEEFFQTVELEDFSNFRTNGSAGTKNERFSYISQKTVWVWMISI